MSERPNNFNVNIPDGFNILAAITFYRSDKSTIIKRVDHNIIDVISYIGGLATSILVFIQLIANQYNHYAFEMEYSYRLYSKQQNQKIQDKSSQNKL